MNKIQRIHSCFVEKRKHIIENAACDNRNASSGPNQRHPLQWETEKGSINPVFRNLKWIIVKDGYECDQVLSFLESKMDGKQYMGLDLEFDPCFRKGQSTRTALLQLGVHTGHCLLVQVIKMKTLPPRLVKLLTDPKVLKVGVGIRDDVIRLKKDFNVQVQGWLDLRQIAPPAQKQGLAALTLNHLNTVLPKNRKIIMSKWSEKLSLEKKAYAAKDAYVAVLLTPKLVAKKLKISEDSVCQNDILIAKKGTET